MTTPRTKAGEAMARRLHVHFSGCAFAKGPKKGMVWPDLAECDCGALREIRAIEAEAATPLPRPEIDVERLARALHSLEAWPTADPELCLQGPGHDLRRAERVLAAYNREKKQG